MSLLLPQDDVSEHKVLYSYMALFIDILGCFSLAAAVGPPLAAMRQMPPVQPKQLGDLKAIRNG